MADVPQDDLYANRLKKPYRKTVSAAERMRAIDEPNRSVVMVFRATPAEREAVEQRAIREQVGISEVLRRAIAAYLEKGKCA